jgi:hypothetical protein
MDDGAAVHFRRRRLAARFAPDAATERRGKKRRERQQRIWRSTPRIDNVGFRGEIGHLPISGLVITLDADPRQNAEALRVLAENPRITVGERFGLRLAVVSDTKSSVEAEELVRSLFLVPGVAFVDIVCIDMSLDEEGFHTELSVDVAPAPDPDAAQGGPH